MGFFSKLLGIPSEKEKKHSPSCCRDSVHPAPTAISVADDDEAHTQDTIKVPIMKPKQRYVLKIDGQYRIYSRKEDMPEEIRKEVDEMEYIADNASTYYTVYVEGKRVNYRSLEEVPPEIRNAIMKSDLH